MSKKTIFVDGLGLVDGHFSGIGQYILGLLRGLDALIEEQKLNGLPSPEVKVIVPRDEVKKFKKFGFKHIGYKKFPLPFRYYAALWHRGWLPPIDIICGRGVYLFPRFVGMPLLFSKSICVIYDLSFEVHREFSDEGNALFLSKGVKRTLKKSSHVITISDHAKDELCSFYKLKDKDVTVATPAIDPSVMYRRSKREIKKVKEKYNIESEYILALSNLEPRKNLGSLVEAYSGLSPSITKNLSLLLVGVSGWKTDQLFSDIVRRVDGGAKIIRPSKYVKDEDKAAIISGAKMLVYPSHYEGFGIPPVEALACGVPVIVANNSSLPQAVGSAGTLVDINEPGALEANIVKLLGDYDQVLKSTLQKGPEHAYSFSWKSSASKVLEQLEALK